MFLHILDVSLLSDVSYLVACLFTHTSNVSFDGQIFWILIKSTFSILSWLVLFMPCLRNLCLPQDHKDIFSFESVIVLSFILKPTVYLQLIFVYGLRWGRSVHLFFHMDTQLI